MNNKVMQSYVWHDDKCFYVSTVNRESSATHGGGTYAETMVWEYDYDSRSRGDIVGEGEFLTGSIFTHLAICKRIHETGKPDEGGAP